MAGVKSITDRILSDAKAKCEDIYSQAEREADGIRAAAASDAFAARERRLARAREDAARARERRIMAAHMEEKKVLLAAKQALLGEAFAGAREHILALPVSEYEEFLVGLIVTYSEDGAEEVLLSAKDKARLDGKRFINRANEKLKRDGLAKPALQLAEEDLEADAGFVLRRGDVEINCTLDALLAQKREGLEQELSVILFGNG